MTLEARIERAHGYLLLGPRRVPVEFAHTSEPVTPSHLELLEELGRGEINGRAWLLEHPQTYGSQFDEGTVRDARLAALVLCASDDAGNGFAWERRGSGAEWPIYRVDHNTSGFDDPHLAPAVVAGNARELLAHLARGVERPFFVRSLALRRLDGIRLLSPHFDMVALEEDLEDTLGPVGGVLLRSFSKPDVIASITGYLPESHLLISLQVGSPEHTRAPTNATLSFRWLGDVEFEPARGYLQGLVRAGWSVDSSKLLVNLPDREGEPALDVETARARLFGDVG